MEEDKGKDPEDGQLSSPESPQRSETSPALDKAGKGLGEGDGVRAEGGKRSKDIWVLSALLFLAALGIWGIYAQIQARRHPTKYVRIKSRHQGEVKKEWRRKKKPISWARETLKMTKRGMEWLMKQFLEKEGGWPHFQWKEPRAGAPTTALALFAAASQPEVIRRPYLDKLHRAAQFLISRMDSQGAVMEEDDLAYRSYTTALSLLALVKLDKKKYATSIQKLRAYLIRAQLSQLPRTNWQYGAWRYYETGDHLQSRRVDISLTSYVLESLYESGLASSHPVFRRAYLFLRRTQNFRSDTKQYRIYDGGFAFSPRNSKAGEYRTADGDIIYRSYGSATCDGLRSLFYVGLSPTSKRVQAALKWLERNLTLEQNPGFSPDQLTQFKRGIFYYYYHSLAKALIFRKGKKYVLINFNQGNWHHQMIARLKQLQRPGGEWVNKVSGMGEEHAILSTSFALLALSQILKVLPYSGESF